LTTLAWELAATSTRLRQSPGFAEKRDRSSMLQRPTSATLIRSFSLPVIPLKVISRY